MACGEQIVRAPQTGIFLDFTFNCRYNLNQAAMGVRKMLQKTDFKQKLYAEIEKLSPDELERIYKLVVLVKNEFIDITDEECYLTDSWQQAEQEITKAYLQGGLKTYDTVDEMLSDILAEAGE
jgi:hypothetical protein